VIVALYFWDVGPSSVPLAFGHMALDRFKLGRLKKESKISFFKLLGTGKGKSFTPKDADPLRWGLLVCLPEERINSFDNSPLINRWRTIAKSEFRTLLIPIASHGQWAGVEPFEINNELEWVGPVAAITRAKIVIRKNLIFWRAVPPVTKSLKGATGLQVAIGIGEAPIGLQGTFSIWNSAADLKDFAYSDIAHKGAIRATKTNEWYSEELFARFAVKEQRGELKAN
jgi:hypothetical protein